MRLSHCLIFVGALSIAVPAVAQDNAAAPVNVADNMVVDANAAAPAAAPTTTTATTETQEMTSSAAPAPAPAQRGFPWGVLGILGLIGLFGVRKVKG